MGNINDKKGYHLSTIYIEIKKDSFFTNGTNGKALGKLRPHIPSTSVYSSMKVCVYT